MKSKVSKDALQSSFELAKSNVPPLVLPKFESLKPLPSSIFFATLSLGSYETFLASAPGSFPPLQELRKKINNIIARELD